MDLIENQQIEAGYSNNILRLNSLLDSIAILYIYHTLIKFGANNANLIFRIKNARVLP